MPLEATAHRGYQDVWVRGKRARKGYRVTEPRYRALRFALRGLGLGCGAPFTVLDLGANLGYFSVRLSEDLGAQCWAVDDAPGLAEVLAANDPGGQRLHHVAHRLGVEEVRALGTFDVVLALSVLHHMREWRGMLAALHEGARRCLVVETPNPKEQLKQALARQELSAISRALDALGGMDIGRTPAVWDATLKRPLVLVPVEGGLPVTGTVFAGSGNNSAMLTRGPLDWAERALAYRPYPGSLNLRLDDPTVVERLGPAPLHLQDPLRPAGGRRGGDYAAWPARFVEDPSIPVHVMQPGERGHPGALEVWAPVRLRDQFRHGGLADGDRVALEVGV